MNIDIQRRVIKEISDRIDSAGLVQLCTAQFGSFSADTLRRWVADVSGTTPCTQATQAFSNAELLLIRSYADEIVSSLVDPEYCTPEYRTIVSVTFDIEISHPGGTDLPHLINEADFDFDLAFIDVDGAEGVVVKDSILTDFHVSEKSHVIRKRTK